MAFWMSGCCCQEEEAETPVVEQQVYVKDSSQVDLVDVYWPVSKPVLKNSAPAQAQAEAAVLTALEPEPAPAPALVPPKIDAKGLSFSSFVVKVTKSDAGDKIGAVTVPKDAVPGPSGTGPGLRIEKVTTDTGRRSLRNAGEELEVDGLGSHAHVSRGLGDQPRSCSAPEKKGSVPRGWLAAAAATAAARVLPARCQRPSTRFSSFVVKVTKSDAGDKLGAVTVPKDAVPGPCGTGPGLRIEKVTTDGLIAAWNLENPDKQVVAGDFIVSVNGECSDTEKMYNAIAAGQAIELAIQRSI